MEKSSIDQPARDEVVTLKKTVKTQQEQIRNLQKAIGRLETIVRMEAKKTSRAQEVGRRNREGLQVTNAALQRIIKS